MSNQCRAILEKSSLPCFHKSKDLEGSGGDNGSGNGGNGAASDEGNRGNFYTVTPKMNGVAAVANNAANAANGTGQRAGGNAAAGGGEVGEVEEAQQFFEHMISLQKNQVRQASVLNCICPELPMTTQFKYQSHSRTRR
jgi:hypothetical protein